MGRCALLLLVLALTACEAPPVEVSTVDSTIDASDATDDAIDSSDDVARDVSKVADVLVDGHPCRGHDEDFDGVPDECDDCPGLPDPDQVVRAGAVGRACASLIGSPFADATTRLVFDPFVEYLDWKSSGGGPAAFQIDTDTGDDMIGGTGEDPDLRYIVLRSPSPGSATTVVTTVAGLGGGFDKPYHGVIVRAGGDPGHFLMCYLNFANRLGIASTPAEGCTGGPCTLEELASQDVPPEARPKIPGAIVIGLRASITSGVGKDTGKLECRVFDPTQPATLHTADPRFIVAMDLDATRWTSTGSIGLATSNIRVGYGFLDVLVSP